MKKRIFSIFLALSAVATVGTGALSASAACSAWTRDPGWYVSCDWSNRCGPLWSFPGTAYNTGTKTRYCDVNGTQQKETTDFYEKDGCCS